MAFLFAVARYLDFVIGRTAGTALPDDSPPPEAGNGSSSPVSSADGAAAAGGEAGRFLGIDVGDESTNFQAGMWLIGLVGLLATAIPAVFLDPSLGFRRRKRRSHRDWTPRGMLKNVREAVWGNVEEMLARARRKYEK